MTAETDATRAQLTDLATWARDRSRDSASAGEAYAAQCYGAMARTVEMALGRLDDATKAERWQWGGGRPK